MLRRKHLGACLDQRGRAVVSTEMSFTRCRVSAVANQPPCNAMLTWQLHLGTQLFVHDKQLANIVLPDSRVVLMIGLGRLCRKKRRRHFGFGDGTFEF